MNYIIVTGLHECFIEYDLQGNNLDHGKGYSETPEACQNDCKNNDECFAFAWNNNEESKLNDTNGCWMKTKNLKDLQKVDKIDVISGPKYCPGMNFRLITF